MSQEDGGKKSLKGGCFPGPEETERNGGYQVDFYYINFKVRIHHEKIYVTIIFCEK